MLKPSDLMHSRHQSFENTTPCPPYNLAADDMVFAGQNVNLSMGKDSSSAETNELMLQVDMVQDPVLLKRMLVQSEQERHELANNLNLAARLGLGLQQQLEQNERESFSKLQSLQDQNLILQSKANRSKEAMAQLTESENEIKNLTSHNMFLQRELDSSRKELKSFRTELDELAEQMAEMNGEVMDAKLKVNSYARRLGEVETELASTQELNVNLQVQLENALQRQKQSQTSTTQAVKSIQNDLGKVFTESDTMRSTLEELESRQVKCEGKVIEMMTNTREYAQLLEEAQDTIHTLRQESDMEGRSWSSRSPLGASWDERSGPLELDEHFGSRSKAGAMDGKANKSSRQIMEASQPIDRSPSLDMEGWEDQGPLGGSLDAELNGKMGSHNPQEISPSSTLAGLRISTANSSKASLLASSTIASPLSLDNEPHPLQPSHKPSHVDQPTGLPTLAEESAMTEKRRKSAAAKEVAAVAVAAAAAQPTRQSRSGSAMSNHRSHSRAGEEPIPPRMSLSAELHQRLEERNILQTVLPANHNNNSNSSIVTTNNNNATTTPSNSRPEWNSSTLLEKPAPTRPKYLRSNSSTNSSTANLHASSTAASTAQLPNGGVKGTSPRHRNSLGMDHHHTLGLKYLLSATSASDLSNVITKTKTNGFSMSNGSGHASMPATPTTASGRPISPGHGANSNNVTNNLRNRRNVGARSGATSPGQISVLPGTNSSRSLSPLPLPSPRPSATGAMRPTPMSTSASMASVSSASDR